MITRRLALSGLGIAALVPVMPGIAGAAGAPRRWGVWMRFKNAGSRFEQYGDDDWGWVALNGIGKPAPNTQDMRMFTTSRHEADTLVSGLSGPRKYHTSFDVRQFPDADFAVRAISVQSREHAGCYPRFWQISCVTCGSWERIRLPVSPDPDCVERFQSIHRKLGCTQPELHVWIRKIRATSIGSSHPAHCCTVDPELGGGISVTFDPHCSGPETDRFVESAARQIGVPVYIDRM